jgi:hypothetical protein
VAEKWQRSGRVKKDGEEIRKELSTPSPIIICIEV